MHGGVYADTSIKCAGDITAAAFYETSDARTKSILDENYVNEQIDQIRAKRFLKNGVEQIGYIAQEVQNIMPSAVKEDENGLLTLSYVDILVAKIAQLENRIKELENKLNQ